MIKIKARMTSRTNTDQEEWAPHLTCKRTIYITLTYRITISNLSNNCNIITIMMIIIIMIIMMKTMHKCRVDEVQRVEGHWQRYGRMSNNSAHGFERDNAVVHVDSDKVKTITT